VTARAIWRRSIERILEAITGALLVVLAVEVLAGIAFRAAADTLVLPPTAAFGVAIELRTPA